VAAGNLYYTSENGILYNKSKTKLLFYPSSAASGTVTILNSVTEIGSMVFASCTGLTGINIPTGLKIIGTSAFSGCTGLANITIPAGVTSIGASAFFNCSSLTSITIPASVMSIGDNAFRLTGLTSVTIPASVTTIGDMAFSYCTNLARVTFEGSSTNIIGDDAFAFVTGNNLTTLYRAGSGGAGIYTRSSSTYNWSKFAGSASFNTLSANGDATTTTTQLTLTFNTAITGLTASDITLNGVPGVTKGTLTGSGPSYTLPISGFISSGELTVSVSKLGYTITNPERSVQIYFYYSGGGSKYNGVYSGTLMNNADYSEEADYGVLLDTNSISGGNIIISNVSIGTDTNFTSGATGTWAYVYSGSKKIGIVVEMTLSGTTNRRLAIGLNGVNALNTLWSSYGLNAVTSDLDTTYYGVLNKQ